MAWISPSLGLGILVGPDHYQAEIMFIVKGFLSGFSVNNLLYCNASKIYFPRRSISTLRLLVSSYAFTTSTRSYMYNKNVSNEGA